MDVNRVNEYDLNFVDGNGHLSIVLYLGGCNLVCPYCFNKELVAAKPTHTLKDILHQYRSIHNAGYVLSGGEPTISKHFLPLFDKCKDRLLTFHTNGMYLPDIDYTKVDQVVIGLKGQADVPFAYDTYISKLSSALKRYKGCKYKEVRAVSVPENREDYLRVREALQEDLADYTFVTVEDSRKSIEGAV